MLLKQVLRHPIYRAAVAIAEQSEHRTWLPFRGAKHVARLSSWDWTGAHPK